MVPSLTQFHMNEFNADLKNMGEMEFQIAFVGNPNVGKTTLFNIMTNSNQHTGNWTGKTVECAEGYYQYKGRSYGIVDLPGTYSMIPKSAEEEVTVEFLKQAKVDCTVIVIDATCFERNLGFVLQVMHIATKPVLCVNLLDEAEKKGITIDFRLLGDLLGIPVVGTSAGRGSGVEKLKETIRNLTDGFIRSEPILIEANHDDYTEYLLACMKKAKELSKLVVDGHRDFYLHKYDRFLLGKFTGRLMMFVLLFFVFWLTIVGANYPSMLLQNIFLQIENVLQMMTIKWPLWLSGLLIDGAYSTTANVVAVMLPPLLIFYPLFTILEDIGYLPRVAFLMDHSLQRCGSCGKQALTMTMGIGCNAVGVIGSRIIESPRERILAVVTNALMPCNGRFPTIIALINLSFSSNPFVAALILTGYILLSVLMTYLSNHILNRSVLKSDQSYFLMELPSFRRPNFRRLLSASVKNKVLFVLSRAVLVAFPTGIVVWFLENIEVSGLSLLSYGARCFDPIGAFLGMNGAILMAYFMSFPANELLLPMLLLIMGCSKSLSIGEMFLLNSWTRQIAVCMSIFTLFHWPCATTCLSILRETGSRKAVFISIMLPTLIGILLCCAVNVLWN